ncbi:MAG: hypothetical protein AB7F76_15985 [Parvibaculaceae bacterium]
MRISTIAKLLAAGGILAIVAASGTAPVTAADSCFVTNVQYHIRKCPDGAAYDGGSAGTADIDVNVEPVSGPPETCFKTNIMLHIRRCTAE